MHQKNEIEWASHYVQKMKPEDKLQEFFESKGIFKETSNIVFDTILSSEASIGFYNASGCFMNVVPITPPHKIMTVKQWKAIHELKAEYQKANAMTQKIDDLKKEIDTKLEKFFKSKGIDKIDSDEYDKL